MRSLVFPWPNGPTPLLLRMEIVFFGIRATSGIPDTDILGVKADNVWEGFFGLLVQKLLAC
jgi:hypothetical protein